MQSSLSNREIYYNESLPNNELSTLWNTRIMYTKRSRPRSDATSNQTLPVPTCQSASAVFPSLCQTPSKSSTSRPFRQGKRGSMTHHRTSPYTADNRVLNVQRTLVLDRPERSGDLEPAGSRADNRVHNVQWTLALDRPERSGDLEPQVPGRYAS